MGALKDNRRRRRQIFGTAKEVVCVMCGKLYSHECITLDHIRPVSKGGAAQSRKNLQAMCRWCNQSKGSDWDGESGYPTLEVWPHLRPVKRVMPYAWIPGLPKRHPAHDLEYKKLRHRMQLWEIHGKNYFAGSSNW